MKKILSIALTLMMMFALAAPVFAATAVPPLFFGGTVQAIDKKGYDCFDGFEITSNNCSAKFDKFSLIADNKTLCAWYIDVAEDISGSLEVAYKVGSQYYIVTFAINGPGKYRIADSKGGEGANMVKVGAFEETEIAHTHVYQCEFTYDREYLYVDSGITRYYTEYRLLYKCACGDSYTGGIRIEYGIHWHYVMVLDGEDPEPFNELDRPHLYTYYTSLWIYNSDGVQIDERHISIPVDPWDYVLNPDVDYLFPVSVSDGANWVYNISISVTYGEDGFHSFGPTFLPYGELNSIDRF